jgi:hypothetical protein
MNKTLKNPTNGKTALIKLQDYYGTPIAFVRTFSGANFFATDTRFYGETAHADALTFAEAKIK